MKSRSIMKLAMAVAAAVAVSSCNESPSAQLDQGQAAYDREDWQAAYRLLKPLADQGYAPAQYNLGVMYRDGKGVPQDYATAASWLRKAAEGNAAAQSRLGRMYENGQGVAQDYAVAASWYRKAADQGDVSAQGFLGMMYYNGKGVPQDYVQAHKWWNLSAAGAKHRSEGDADSRDQLATLMTPAQIAEAQRQASEWKAK